MGRLTGANVNKPMAIVLGRPHHQRHPISTSKISESGIIQGRPRRFFSRTSWITWWGTLPAPAARRRRLGDEPISEADRRPAARGG